MNKFINYPIKVAIYSTEMKTANLCKAIIKNLPNLDSYLFSDKEEFHRSLQTEGYSIAICDVFYSGISSNEIDDTIRDIIKINQGIYTIFLSERNEITPAITCFRLGAGAFLLKPFKKAVLEEILDNALAKFDKWNCCFEQLVSNSKMEKEFDKLLSTIPSMNK